MRKKGYVYLLILAFLLTFCTPGPVIATGNFPDISTHWGKDSIVSLASAGYISGYPDGTFKPDKTVSQAEFITVLISCMGITPTDTTTQYFNDTSEHWALGSINEAVKRRILIPSEYSNAFRPNSGLKRSQAAAMMVRALGKEESKEAIPFTDLADVQKSYYRGFINTAFDLKLLKGYPDGKFKPYEYITRAQMCTVILNFMEINAQAPVDSWQPPVDNSLTGSTLTSIAIGDEVFDLNFTPVYFKTDFTNTRIYSLNYNNDYITVNSRYRFFLDSAINNPDIVVYNNCYGVDKFLVSGNKLVAYPSYHKVDSISHGNLKYQSDFVKLYINATYTEKYLGDMEILDATTVKINGKTYDLNKDKITIELGSDFYDITRIDFGSTETLVRTVPTDKVIIKGIDIRDIAAIFSDDKSLDLERIDKIEFIIDGEHYSLSNVIIDASGNFTVRQETFAPEDVDMIVDNNYYKIDYLKIYKDKFYFYCTSSESDYWVRLNKVYVDTNQIKILKDNTAYDIDQVLVVKRNVVRIKGKQYDIDSTFKCMYRDDVYDIDRIDYDNTLDCITIIGTKTQDSYWANQPSKYVFFENDYKYQDGATDDVNIYADRKWLNFDQIMVTDPAHFTYNGKTYNMIGALVRIGKVDFEIIDTAWQGRNRVLNIYLQKI
ncbi:MAG TPA: S-layer homology domain-containing protein [Gelria sp.]|nr:S-layer homology domain-containing protein [Gelria sp.]